MNFLPWKAKLYIVFISTLGIGIALYFTYRAFQEPMLWFAILGVTAVVAILDIMPIKPYGSSVEMTISNVAKFAAVLMFPPAVPILATCLGTLVGELASRRPWFKRIFNVAVMTVTFAVVVAVYTFLNQPHADLLSSPQSVIVLILSGLTNFGVNSVLVGLVISLAGEISFRYVWLQNYSKVVLHDLTMIPLAISVAILWRFSPLTVSLAVLPLLVVRHSYQTTNYLQRQTEDALKALMRTVDERDNETFDHSERVSKLAKEIGKAMGMPPAELDLLVPAALLHDLGKVGMESNILFKPGGLTPAERQRAQRHAAVGAELLSKFPLFEKGALLVRHHHEQYDGNGYPDRLKGEKIPLGARIIAVADAYQAMTEDRPYRRALPPEQALGEMRKCSGTQFDPRVVQALIQITGTAKPVGT
jgi:putative nucleotidyltransferase with HDIG domain